MFISMVKDAKIINPFQSPFLFGIELKNYLNGEYIISDNHLIKMYMLNLSREIYGFNIYIDDLTWEIPL